jgi:hypothetical protein
VLSDPNKLLTTTVQDLINALVTGSPGTNVVDYLYDTMLPQVKTAASAMTSVLTARISVPGVTDVLEAIMEGRTLTALRLAAFIAAIAKVLALKISAAASSGSMSPQPVSYASAEETMTRSVWAGFAFSVLFGIVEWSRSSLELKASSPALRKKKATLDAMLGTILAGRACCTYGMLEAQSVAGQVTMGVQASAEIIFGLSQIGFAGWKYFTTNGDHTNLAVQSVISAILIIDAITAASLGVYQSGTDWAKFAMQTSGTIFGQLAVVMGLAVDLAGSSGKSVVPAQVAFGILTGTCDLALASTDAATL